MDAMLLRHEQFSQEIVHRNTFKDRGPVVCDHVTSPAANMFVIKHILHNMKDKELGIIFKKYDFLRSDSL